jgi:hypothetical protein
MPEPIFMKLGTCAHLKGVIYKSLSSVCESTCVSFHSLLGNGSVDSFPCQRIHATVEEFVKLDVVTAAAMKNTNFCDITPCSQLKANRVFGGTYQLHPPRRQCSSVDELLDVCVWGLSENPLSLLVLFCSLLKLHQL